jgi:hypothetical protein
LNWPGSTDLSDISCAGIGQPLVRSRIKDFCGGVYKTFAVQGPMNLTVQLRRNQSVNAILAAVMLDTLQERPAPYFGEQAPPATGPSAALRPGAPEDGFLKQLQCSSEGSLQGPAKDRICYAMLLRHLLAAQGSEQISKRSPRIGTCLFALNLFDHWEAYQRAQGLMPARDIEKSLRWKQAIPNNSGRGRLAVQEYLAAHPEINPLDSGASR